MQLFFVNLLFNSKISFFFILSSFLPLLHTSRNSSRLLLFFLIRCLYRCYCVSGFFFPREFFYYVHFYTVFHKSARQLLLFQILFHKLCTASCMFFLQTLFSPFSPAPVAGESRVYCFCDILINQKLENPISYTAAYPHSSPDTAASGIL